MNHRFLDAGSTLAGRDGDRIQERHLGPQLRSNSFDHLILLTAASRFKPWAAILIFSNPFFRVRTILNLTQHLTHFIPRFFGYDTRASRVVAMLSRVTDRVA